MDVFLKFSKNRFCIASWQHQVGVRTVHDSIPASEGAVEALAANFLDNFRGRAVEHPDLWSKWRMKQTRMIRRGSKSLIHVHIDTFS